MDKNKTLVDKKQYHIDKIYDAIRWNETVCDLFCVCDVRLEESGIIAESFYADIINNEMKGEVGRILKQQKCFGYTEQDSLILYLFCTRLRGFHCLESDNDADGNCRGIVGMINQMKLEQRIMLIYRLLCENLKAIRFYPLSEDVGIEVKNEHVVTDSVIDQFIRIKNEASKLKTIGRYRNEDDDKLKLLDVTVESKESNSQNIGIMEFIKSKLPANFDNKVEVCFKFEEENFNVFVWYDKKSGEMRFISNNFAATKSEFDFVENKLLEKKYFDYQKGNEFILNLFTCYLKKSLEAEQPDCFIDLTEIQNDKIQEIYNKFVANVSGIWFKPKPSLLSKQGIESVEKMLPELDQIAIDCKKFDEKSYAKFIDWNSSDTLKKGLQKERMKKIKSGKIPLNKITYLSRQDYYDYYFTRVINDNVPTILDDTLIEPNELFDVINKNKTPAFHTKIKNLLGPYELFSAQQCIELINKNLIKLNFGNVGTRSSISFDEEKDKLASDLFSLVKIIFFKVRGIYDVREHLCDCESKDKRQLAQAIINHLPNMIDDNEEDRAKKIEIIKDIIGQQKYKDEFFELVGADTVINIDDFFQGVKKNKKKVLVDNFVQFVKDNNLVITQDNFSFFMSWLKDNICVDSSDNLKKLMECVVSRLRDKEFGSAERINLIEFMNDICEDQNLHQDINKLADCYYKLVEDIIKNDKFKNDDSGKCTIYPSSAAKILDYMFIMQNKFKSNPVKIVEIINAITAQPIRECFQFGSFINEACKVFKKYDFRSICKENTKNELSDKEICDTLNKTANNPIDTDQDKYKFEIKFGMDSAGHLFLPLLLQHQDQAQRQNFCLKLGNKKYVDNFLKNLKDDTSCFDNVLSIRSFDVLISRFKKSVINHSDAKKLPDPRDNNDNREMLLRSELLKPKFSVESLSKIFENIFSKQSNAITEKNFDQFTDWLVYVLGDYSDLIDEASKYIDNNLQLYDYLIKKCFRNGFKLSVDQGIDFIKKLTDKLNGESGKKNIIDGSFVVDFIAGRCLKEDQKFTPTEVIDLTQKLISKLNTADRGLIDVSVLERFIVDRTNFDIEYSHNTKIKDIFSVLAEQHKNGKKIDGNVYQLLVYVLCNKFGKFWTQENKLFEYYDGKDGLIKEEIAEIVSAFNSNKIFEVNKEKYEDMSKLTGIKFNVSNTGQIIKVIFGYKDRYNEYTAEVDIKNEIEEKNGAGDKFKSNIDVNNNKLQKLQLGSVLSQERQNFEHDENLDNEKRNNDGNNNEHKEKIGLENKLNTGKNIVIVAEGKKEIEDEVKLGLTSKQKSFENQSKFGHKDSKKNIDKNDIRDISALKIRNTKMDIIAGEIKNVKNLQASSLPSKQGDTGTNQGNNRIFTWDVNFCIGVILVLCALAAVINSWILVFVLFPGIYAIYKGFKCHKQRDSQKTLTELNLQVDGTSKRENENKYKDKNNSLSQYSPVPSQGKGSRKNTDDPAC